MCKLIYSLTLPSHCHHLIYCSLYYHHFYIPIHSIIVSISVYGSCIPAYGKCRVCCLMMCVFLWWLKKNIDGKSAGAKKRNNF